MTILVIDVGTSSVRASLVRADGSVDTRARRPLPPILPAEGLVEIDAGAVGDAVLDVAHRALEGADPVDAVGVTAQRASSIAWTADGQPVGNGLGWQDLRTAGTCLELQADGLRFSPSESGPKFATLLDTHDPRRSGGLRLGTVDTWVVWVLSGGAAHITDPTNAAVTGIWDPAAGWRDDLLQRLNIPADALPSVVDSTGRLAEASALPGSPPICSLVGDQQASLVGQGCTRPGLAKITFGTGAMLDLCTGGERPPFALRGEHGCFPIVAWSRSGTLTWGVEAMALTAGTAVDWLVEDLGVLDGAGASEDVAASVEDSGGVVVVPAFLGMGTPAWDFGARATVSGLTRGSSRAHLVRAVLEGVAHRGADLLDAAEADAGEEIRSLRVDGGMTANRVFLQALADACGRPVEVSPELEATTLGAGYLAGLATGDWGGTEEIAAAWSPRATVEPSGRDPGRDRWHRAVEAAKGWHRDLTALRF
jgi:glycerol kinase